MNSENAEYYYYRGLSKYSRAQAIDCFKQAISLNPYHVEAHYQLGCALEALGFYKEAVESFERVIELNPTHSDAHRRLPLAREKTSKKLKVEQAEQIVKKTPAKNNERSIKQDC